VLDLGDVRVDLKRGEVLRGVERLPLTTKERDLLAYLASHAGTDVGREELNQEVWGHAPSVSSRALDNTVRRLRKKIEASPAEPRWLLTAYGFGYRLELSAAPSPEPVVTSHLIGREAELGRLAATVRAGRITTIVGPGGAGKTTLLRALQPRLTDAVWVDLTSALEPDHAWRQIGAAVGAPLTPARTAEAIVHDHLSSKPATLFLDNIEQIADFAPSVGRVLSAVPGLCLAATSRVPLGLALEDVLRLDGLPTSDACALYLRHATIEPQEHGALVDLATALDGLPLALELAARRSALLGPRALLARLGDLPRLLGTTNDANPRHASLSAVIAWSWSLLGAPAKHALIRLSPCRGPIPLDVAVGLVDDLDALQDLADHSLVQRRETTLHLATGVAAFAREEGGRTGAGEEAVRHHAQVIHRLARSALDQQRGGARHAEPLLRDLEDQLVAASEQTVDATAACQAAIALHEATWRRWTTTSQLHLLDRAERLAAQEAPDQRAQVQVRKAGALFLAGRGPVAAALLDRLELEALDWRTAAFALYVRAVLHRTAGETAEAEATLQRGIRLYQDHADPIGECTLLGLLAVVARDRGDNELAVEHATRTIELAWVCGADAARSRAHLTLGNVARSRKRLAEAMDHYAAVTDLALELGDANLTVAVLGLRAGVHQENDELDDALSLGEQAVKRAQEAGLTRLHAHALDRVAEVLHQRGDLSAALATRRSALHRAQAAGDAHFVAFQKAGIAELLRQQSPSVEEG